MSQQQPSPTSSTSVSDQASAWFVRLQADDVSHAERSHFQAWYRADPQNANAYESTRKLWSVLQLPAERVQERLKTETPASTDPKGNDLAKLNPEPNPLFPHRLKPALTHQAKCSASRRGGFARRIATLACLSLLWLSITWYLPAQLQNWQSDYHTAPGQQLKVSLADGSRLTLNTDTALVISFTPQQRRIELLRGEAYFEVASNKARPFIVDGGRADARAVGTAFSVAKRADDLRVSVNEGTVEVSADSASTLVNAGRQVDYRDGQIQAVHKVDSDDAFAWRRGQVVFARQPLAEVLADVNRYRNGRIVAVNPDLAERIVSGVFNIGDADAVVDALKATLHAQTVNVPGGLVLLY